MVKKKIQVKDIVYYVVLLVILGLLFWPKGNAFVKQQMMKIGFFQPNIEKGKLPTEGSSASLVQTETLDLLDMMGNKVNTHDWKGKVLFINFWATWCGPCLAEMPSIQKLYDQYRDHEDILFLLVEVDGNQPGAIEYLEKENLNLPIYFPLSNIPKAWLDGTIPSTVVLDKSGRRVFEQKGVADYTAKDFEEYIVSLINEKNDQARVN